MKYFLCKTNHKILNTQLFYKIMLEFCMNQSNYLNVINNKFQNFGKRILKLKWFFVIFFTGFVVFNIFGLFKLQTGIRLDRFFLDHDPVIIEKNLFEKYFENNDFVGILVDADDVFDKETLMIIRDLGQTAKTNVPYVNELVSLTDFKFYSHQLGGVIDASEYNIKEITDLQIKQLKNLFKQKKNLVGKLYSKDETQTWILLRLEKYPPEKKWPNGRDPVFVTGEKAWETVENFKTKHSKKLKELGIKFTPAGNPITAARKNYEMFREMAKIVSIAGALGLIFIFLTIRFIPGVAGTAFIIIGSIISVFGSMGYLGLTADTTFMLVPILLSIAVSISYSIHLTNFYKKGIQKKGNVEDAMLFAFHEAGWPILFTVLTTALSLLSFLLIPVKTIRWVGMISAISITTVYFFLIFFYSSFIVVTGKLTKSEKVLKIDHAGKFEENLFHKLSLLVNKKGSLISVIFVMIVFVVLFGTTKIHVSLHPKEMYGTKLPHIKDQIYVSEARVGSVYSYDIMLASENSAQDEPLIEKYEFFKKFDKLITYISKQKDVKNVYSVMDHIRSYNQSIYMSPVFYKFPSSRETFYKWLEVYTNRHTVSDTWVHSNGSAFRISVNMSDFNTDVFSKQLTKTRKKIQELFNTENKDKTASVQTAFTGFVVQIDAMNRYVTIGLVKSFLIAITIVCILMMISFSSIKLGLISMIPNISPVFVAGGLMGFIGAPLEFITMTIAPMVLGLAVDDTIHFINHCKLEFLRTGNYEIAIEKTFINVGRALAQANLILCVVFAAFLLAKVVNMQNMGIYTIAALSAALAADYFVTPTLIKLAKPFGPEKSVR